MGAGPSRAGRGRGHGGSACGLLLAGGKVLTDMGAVDLGADRAELCWPLTMPDAASEAPIKPPMSAWEELDGIP